MAIVEEVKFKGKDEKVIVRPILSRSINPNVTDPEHEAFFLFGGSSRKFCLPMDRQGNLISPFETDEERSWLEKELDTDLNVHKKTDNFWNKFKVSLAKEERTLNLRVPQDYLDFVVLKMNRQHIAPLDTKKDHYLATQRYALVREDADNKEVVTRVTKEIEAYKAFGKMEDNKQEMINFLKVYGQTAVNIGPKNTKVTLSTKRETVIKMVSDVIEKDINGFLTTIRDKDNYELKLLVANAVEVGAVIKESRKYFLPGGDALCGEGLVPTIDNVIEFLKNPKNQDIKLMLTARVDHAKE